MNVLPLANRLETGNKINGLENLAPPTELLCTARLFEKNQQFQRFMTV